MAEKTEKKNRVVELILKEHKYENLVLAILSIFAIELGVLLNTESLTIPSTAFLIGDFPKVFAWILIGLGVISLILSIASFYRPSFSEIKHITGLKRSEFLWNIVKVIVFIIVLALFFTASDLLINFIKGLF